MHRSKIVLPFLVLSVTTIHNASRTQDNHPACIRTSDLISARDPLWFSLLQLPSPLRRSASHPRPIILIIMQTNAMTALIWALAPLPNFIASCTAQDDFSQNYSSGPIDFARFITAVFLVRSCPNLFKIDTDDIGSRRVGWRYRWC